MSAPVRLRPHHILCSLGFQGHGYSNTFTANMAEVVGRLRAPGGEEMVIEITGQADAICAPCPRRLGTSCLSHHRINTLDAAHGAALGIVPGDRITWGDAQDRVRDNVAPDDLDILCEGCPWASAKKV